MAQVILEKLSKSYGSVDVLKDIDLTVDDGEFVVLVGPSGCGKSTLLRAISGLEPVSGGRIRIGDQDATSKEPVDRGVGMVFQSYALYPHMTVAQNIGFGLKIAGKGRAEIDRAVRQVAAVLQLEGLLHRKPRALSGGQRQRVAIGRSLARRPSIFLFDEPLSNLDAALRVEMRVELSKLHHELNATMIYVTHDQVEAMTMADRIVVMDQGRVMQVGSPLELFNRPCNRFVAGFLGQPSTNFLKVTDAAETDAGLKLRAGGGVFSLPRPPATAAGGGFSELGLRPDWFGFAQEGEGGEEGEAGEAGAMIHADVTLAEQLGDETLIHTALATGESLVLKMAGQHVLRRGSRISLKAKFDFPMAFDAAGRNVYAGSA